MKTILKRSHRTIELENPSHEIIADRILEKNCYKKIDVLDIANHKEIKWEWIEFNGLFVKDGLLYRFNNWIGKYLYARICIEEIGSII